MRNTLRSSLLLRLLFGVLSGVLILLTYAPQSSAIAGVRRRAVRRTAIVVSSADKSAEEKQMAAAQQQQAAAQQQEAAQTAAAQSAAAAAQASAASAAAATQAAAHATKTPQQKLADLEGLYKEGLISEADYNAAKAKILAQIVQ